MSIDDLQAALSAPPPKACDAVDWTFAGLSMATWNAVLSPLFAIAAGLSARALLRRQSEARP
jgi:disulfide bond formation protein DsbB